LADCLNDDCLNDDRLNDDWLSDDWLNNSVTLSPVNSRAADRVATQAETHGIEGGAH
jgi:hypothetical protein